LSPSRGRRARAALLERRNRKYAIDMVVPRSLSSCTGCDC
jgi:hypothetical protein